MSNILNFSWCFLYIPAIYRCILAYLPIFFNQLSKFLRCESPSTFLGTCLSHHSFIIFLVTNTNTLLSGLYLISTKKTLHFQSHLSLCVNALSGLYLISTCLQTLLYIEIHLRVNALSGLYLISTIMNRLRSSREKFVSMPSRAYTSFLQRQIVSAANYGYSVNALSGLYLISTVPLQKPRFYAVSRACFCRYLSEYSDNSRFSCMLTIWTYLMKCTYPWHWI